MTRPTHPGRAVGVVLLSLILTAESPSERPEAVPTRIASETYTGFLVARHATDHFAPEFTFRVPGWSSSSGSQKIVELVADGTAVKKGQLVARFEFGFEQALDYINDRIAQLETSLQQATIYAAQTKETLELNLRRARMGAETARLNVLKAPAVSKNQAEALAQQQRLAEFEVEAAMQRLSSATASAEAARIHATQQRDAALMMRDRYAYYLERFTVRASHDGIVRHAFNPRERRTLQKGDGVQAGTRVVSVAKDDALAVRFFVPEAHASQVHEGQRLRIQIPTSAEELDGVVERVDFFPQELGYLLENESLPYAREKAIQVMASVVTTSTLATGTEIRVRLVSAEQP